MPAAIITIPNSVVRLEPLVQEQHRQDAAEQRHQVHGLPRRPAPINSTPRLKNR